MAFLVIFVSLHHIEINGGLVPYLLFLALIPEIVHWIVEKLDD